MSEIGNKYFTILVTVFVTIAIIGLASRFVDSHYSRSINISDDSMRSDNVDPMLEGLATTGKLFKVILKQS